MSIHDHLIPYLPIDRWHALATRTPLPDQSWGTALVADLAGFTTLTERLVHEVGAKHGADAMASQMKRVYDALVTPIHAYHGSVIGFAGDAMICWFDGDSGGAATACALAMQQAMDAFHAIVLPSGSQVCLALKIGIATGSVRRFLVGNPHIQYLETLAGATVQRMAAAEQHARPGDIVLDATTVEAHQDTLEIAAWRPAHAPDASYAVVTGLRCRVPPNPWPPLTATMRDPESLQPWVLPTVSARLADNHDALLTQIRPVVALFVRFQGIAYDADAAAGEKLDAFIRWIQAVVSDYEGTLVDLTLGDKGSYLYLAFGAPVTHENDALRAVRVAQILRHPPPALGIGTAVQIGMSRGTMFAGVYGAATRRTYGVVGDEANVAARLMQAAAPGQVLVSGRVQAEVGAAAHWRSMAPLALKGKSGLVTVFTLEEHAASVGRADDAVRSPIPLIGRQRPLTQITTCLDAALHRSGHIVILTGEPGIGKSRLVAAVIPLAQARGMAVYEGRCQSYGTHIAYLPWEPLLRAFLGIPDSDPPADQVQALTERFFQRYPALLPHMPLLRDILHVPIAESALTQSMDAAQRKAARETLLVTLVTAHATPMLLILEDAHWMDELSYDLLLAIARTSRQVPIGILVTTRPAASMHAPAVPPDLLDRVCTIALTELDAQESRTFMRMQVAQHGGSADHLDQLLDRLYLRTQGNPFYMEEFLKYVLAQAQDLTDPAAVAAIELPLSLESVILSRLDQLSDREQLILKVASILGRSFHVPWLWGYYPAVGTPDLVRQTLAVLQHLHLTLQETPEPDLVYRFRHVVTQEVTYGSLPHSLRAVLHEQVAHYLEAMDNPARYLDLLAYHYARSPNRAKASTYLRQAGAAAQAVYANAASEEYYTRALDLLSDESRRDRAAIMLALGSVQELRGRWEHAEAQFQEAYTIAQEIEEITMVQESQLRLGHLLTKRGAYGAALPWLAQALQGAEAGADLRAQSRVLSAMGLVFWRQGRFMDATRTVQDAYTRAHSGDHQAEMAAALNHLGSVAYFQGLYPQAAQYYQRSLAIREALGNKHDISASANNLGRVAYEQGQYADAERWFALSRRLDEEMGDRWGIAIMRNNEGLVAQAQGALAEAQVAFEAALALRQAVGDAWGITISLTNLGIVTLLRGDEEQARHYFTASLRHAVALGDHLRIAAVLVGMASVAWHTVRTTGTTVPSRIRPILAWLALSDQLRTACGGQFDLNVRTLDTSTRDALAATLGGALHAHLEASVHGLSLDNGLQLAFTFGQDGTVPSGADLICPQHCADGTAA